MLKWRCGNLYSYERGTMTMSGMVNVLLYEAGHLCDGAMSAGLKLRCLSGTRGRVCNSVSEADLENQYSVHV